MADALGKLPGPDGERFATVFEHGSLDVEIYALRGEDLQTPHTRDEVYIVIEGEGFFLKGGVRLPFSPGDFCLFLRGWSTGSRISPTTLWCGSCFTGRRVGNSPFRWIPAN